MPCRAGTLHVCRRLTDRFLELQRVPAKRVSKARDNTHAIKPPNFTETPSYRHLKFHEIRDNLSPPWLSAFHATHRGPPVLAT